MFFVWSCTLPLAEIKIINNAETQISNIINRTLNLIFTKPKPFKNAIDSKNY
jgi:hypothetical protein